MNSDKIFVLAIKYPETDVPYRVIQGDLKQAKAEQKDLARSIESAPDDYKFNGDSPDKVLLFQLAPGKMSREYVSVSIRELATAE